MQLSATRRLISRTPVILQPPSLHCCPLIHSLRHFPSAHSSSIQGQHNTLHHAPCIQAHLPTILHTPDTRCHPPATIHSPPASEAGGPAWTWPPGQANSRPRNGSWVQPDSSIWAGEEPRPQRTVSLGKWSPTSPLSERPRSSGPGAGCGGRRRRGAQESLRAGRR